MSTICQSVIDFLVLQFVLNKYEFIKSSPLTYVIKHTQYNQTFPSTCSLIILLNYSVITLI